MTSIDADILKPNCHRKVFVAYLCMCIFLKLNVSGPAICLLFRVKYYVNVKIKPSRYTFYIIQTPNTV